MPQHRFASIHVVGTNGKTSVAEMTVALLEAHGVSAGAHVSPHEERWSERVRIGTGEIEPEAFAAAVERVAESVEVVNRRLEEGDAVTQFEASAAAAFVALAAARVDVGVIEAGLGGRLDATNVLPSRVTALSSVGLEHTQWLGDTVEEIATEKLAVLGNHSTLVLGRVDEGVEGLARRMASERQAQVVAVRGLAPQVRLASHGAYQRRNFAVALACADQVVDSLDPERVAAVAGALELHGRVEVAAGDPPLILDAAHNPDGARALAEALPEAAGERPIVACVATLADKDAAGIVGALAPSLAGIVATEIPASQLEHAGRPGAESLPAEKLAEIASAAGIGDVAAVAEPQRALRRALAGARERGGVALACGSHYLLGYASRN